MKRRAKEKTVESEREGQETMKEKRDVCEREGKGKREGCATE